MKKEKKVVLIRNTGREYEVSLPCVLLYRTPKSFRIAMANANATNTVTPRVTIVPIYSSPISAPP